MKKTIKVKKDKVTGDGYVLLKEFKDILDIKKVHSYSLEELLDCDDDTKSLLLKFYDKKGVVIETFDKKD